MKRFVPTPDGRTRIVPLKPPVRMPVHKFKNRPGRAERLQEQELERLASRIPDQKTLDAILGEYPEQYRSRVLGRIRQFLKFEVAEAVA